MSKPTECGAIDPVSLCWCTLPPDHIGQHEARRYRGEPGEYCPPWGAPAPAVRAPSYYRDHPSGVECIEIARHWSFNLGCVLKYLWRHGRKPGADAVDDLRKAADYLNDEIARLEAGGEGT